MKYQIVNMQNWHVLHIGSLIVKTRWPFFFFIYVFAFKADFLTLVKMGINFGELTFFTDLGATQGLGGEGWGWEVPMYYQWNPISIN